MAPRRAIPAPSSYRATKSSYDVGSATGASALNATTAPPHANASATVSAFVLKLLFTPRCTFPLFVCFLCYMFYVCVCVGCCPFSDGRACTREYKLLATEGGSTSAVMLCICDTDVQPGVACGRNGRGSWPSRACCWWCGFQLSVRGNLSAGNGKDCWLRKCLSTLAWDL